MKLENVLVIEDKHSLWGDRIKTKKKSDSNYQEIPYSQVFVGPVDIKTAEFWESRLELSHTPYVLVEAETTIETAGGSLAYRKGYFLLTEFYTESESRVKPKVETANPDEASAESAPKASQNKPDIYDIEDYAV